MKQLFLYIRLQLVLFSLLLLVVILPLVLIFQFSPYQVEGVQYFFLVILLGLKVIFLKDRGYKRRIRKRIKLSLDQELGRPAPGNLLIKRIEEYETARDLILGIVAIMVLSVCVFFGKF